MKNLRSLNRTLAVLALVATSIPVQAASASSAESWHTYRESFLPALEVTAAGELREITDPAQVHALLRFGAPMTRITGADREAFHQRVLSRFDVNGDGRLDEQERASVHAALQSGEPTMPARHSEAALPGENES